MRELSEPTKKLFKAIDDENLEGFKQALAEGADVNAFDEGYTPLMSIIINNDDSHIYLKMMMLLSQHQDLNVNVQEAKERNTALHLAFRMENRNFVRMLLRHPNLDIGVKNNYAFIKPECQQLPEEHLRDFHKKHCSHTPKEYIEQIGGRQKKDFAYLTMEITKAQKGKQLLTALSRNIYLAKTLLNQDLNPNCWERNKNGEIETPLSLIIKSCLQTITRDKEEVLTKLLKHKELDFSQIKQIQAIEKSLRLKQIIAQTITERLTDVINRKDLDDVKKLVEDNCFMNRSVVVAALSNVNDPIESITNYLNEKFPASVKQPLANTNNIPKDFEGFVEELVDELERTKAQLVEKEQELTNKTGKISQLERDLKQVREERDGLSSENRQLKGLNNKNKKSSKVSRNQNGYASTFFVLSGAFAVGACLTIVDYPEIGACLTAGALVLFLVGYYLCKADERDIRPGGTTNNPQVTRVFTSSPNSAENLYTY